MVVLVVEFLICLLIVSIRVLRPKTFVELVKCHISNKKTALRDISLEEVCRWCLLQVHDAVLLLLDTVYFEDIRAVKILLLVE